MVKFAGYEWVKDTFLSNQRASAMTGQSLARAMGHRLALPIRSMTAGGQPLRIVWMGDSDTEGTGAESRHNRFCELVIQQLRQRYPIVGGDEGLGYTPVKYMTFWGFPEGPTISGSYLDVGNDGGLGNRSINMQSGCKVTFPSQPMRYLRVHYTRRPETAYSGVFRVRNGPGGPVVLTIDTNAGAQDRRSVFVDHDFTTVGSRSIEFEWVSGNPRPEGIGAWTSNIGFSGFEAARSGAKIGDYGTLGLIQGGNPDSADRHWEAVVSCNPTMGVFAFGRNDQASYTEAEWRGHLIDVCGRWFSLFPNAPLVFLMAPARVMDVDDDPERIFRFESILLEVASDFPLMTCMFESALWAPRSGVDYSQGDPFGWFAGFGDTTHKSKVGHQLVADYIISRMTVLGAQT